MNLEREFGFEFTWLPYVLEIPDFLGTVEGRNAHQWRRVRYSYMDARRLANRRELDSARPAQNFRFVDRRHRDALRAAAR